LEVTVELILIVVAGVPLGRLLPSRKLALVVLAIAFLIVLPFQTVSVHDEGDLDAAYWPVQAVLALAGAGLVTLGSWWRSKRTARNDGALAG
jgi:hypothetical protein